jgi:GTP diphosphokinase / guanosine-3',5'-bis(diphosphate) 3'-diphosphatase
MATAPERIRQIDGVGSSRVQRALSFAETHLKKHPRRSGESYFVHGCEVAVALSECAKDMSLLSIAILHDILVHPDGEKLLAQAPLSSEEKTLIRKLHPLRRLHIDANTEDLDRVIDAFTEDPKLLPLRMAHRLNDIRHLSRFEKVLCQQIAKETLHMYTAIAGRLGLHAWRHEMEDACFPIVQPKIANALERKMQSVLAIDKTCLAQSVRFLRRELKKQGIHATLTTRRKTLYSTYRKMAMKKRRFEDLTDRLAIRVVVGKPHQCYLALGVVHAVFHPMPGKLKDYIGAPKENGYRSIHTVVYPLPGVTEQPIEVQIRTGAMQAECEFGALQHGEYKNALYALEARPGRVDLFRSLALLKEEARQPKQFTEALRTYFRDDHIALFDAKNNLYHMKSPVSVLDFACHIYGKRVCKLKAIQINGRQRPIDAHLHDGDTVTVLFGKKKMLRKEWLASCRHAGTKKRMKEWLQT